MLTRAKVELVERMLAEGHSQRAVARALRIDRATVRRIAHREHRLQSDYQPSRAERLRRLLRVCGEVLSPLGVELRGAERKRYEALRAAKRPAPDNVATADGDGRRVETCCARCRRPLDVEFAADASGRPTVKIIADGQAMSQCPGCRRMFPALRPDQAKDLLSL